MVTLHGAPRLSFLTLIMLFLRIVARDSQSRQITTAIETIEPRCASDADKCRRALIPCQDQVITVPPSVDQFYKVSDSAGSYELPKFENNLLKCRISYEINIPADSPFILPLSSNRGVKWFTQDDLDVGTTTVEIVAKGQSGVTAKAQFLVTVALEVTSNCSSQNIIVPQAPDNQMYTVYGEENSIEVSVFFFKVKQTNCPLTYSLSVLPSNALFIAGENGRRMFWKTHDNADSGVYTIKCSATLPNFISKAIEYQVTIVKDCSQQILTVPTAADQVYTVRDATASYELPEFGNNEDDLYCPLTYSVTFSPTPKTGFITTLSSKRGVSCISSSEDDSGDYNIKVIATGLKEITKFQTFQLKVIAYCANQSIDAPVNVEDQTYEVYKAQKYYQVPGFSSNLLEEFCPISYTQVVSQDKSLFSQDIDQPNSREMYWQTDKNEDAGTYTITVVGSCPYCIKVEVKYTLTITVGCSGQTWTLPSSTDLTYEIKDDANKYELENFINSDEGFCSTTYSTTISPTPASGFITTLPTKRGVSWFSSSWKDVAVYRIKVFANGPDVSQFKSFVLTVILDCSSQILTPSLLVDQTYTVYAATSWYIVPMFGNDEATNCPPRYSITISPNSSLSWAHVNGRLLQWQTDKNTDSGKYIITCVATGPDGVTAQGEYTLTILINCSKQILISPVTVNQVYKINEDSNTNISSRFEEINENFSSNKSSRFEEINEDFSKDKRNRYEASSGQYSVAKFENDEAVYCPLIYSLTISPMPESLFITTLASNQGVSWKSSTNIDVNVYTIEVTATGTEGVAKSKSFTLTVIYDCSKQNLVPTSTINHIYTVYDSIATYEVTEFGNDEATNCPLVYSQVITPAAKALNIFIPKRTSLQWQTDKNTDEGVYAVSCTGIGPEGVTASVSYTVTIKYTCARQVIVAPTITTQTYWVFDPEVTFGVEKFVNDEPFYCPITYKKTLPSSIDWISDAGLLAVRWQTDKNSDHGTYSIVIEASGPEGGVTKTLTYELKVEINCKNMVVGLPDTINHKYKVNDKLGSYEVEAFTNSEPIYCPLTYQITISSRPTFINTVSERKIDWITSQNSDYGVYTITVEAQCFRGMQWSISYTLTVESDCTKLVLTPPVVVDQVYVVNDPTTSYEIPEFVNSLPKYCIIAYTHTVNNPKDWLKQANSPLKYEWFTNDNAEYGKYMVTFIAKDKIDGVMAEVSWTLTVKRQCLDADLHITAFPSFIPYTITDPIRNQVIQVDSTQTTSQCPHTIIVNMTYANGTALNDDTFTWSAALNQFSIQTSDYGRYADDTAHLFYIYAYYDTYEISTGDFQSVKVELSVDCDRITFDRPVINDITFMIGEDPPSIQLNLKSTICGPWLIEAEKASYIKDSVQCLWCEYFNSHLFKWDIEKALLIIDGVGKSDTGKYIATIPLRVPDSKQVVFVGFQITIQTCVVLTLSEPALDTITYTVWGPPLTNVLNDFVQAPACNYLMLYTWKQKNKTTGILSTMSPEIFTVMDDRKLSVQTEDLTKVGTYLLEMSAMITPVWQFPLKQQKVEVNIIVVNPCLTTVLNQIDPIKLTVPIGKSTSSQSIQVPQDQASLLNSGDGYKNCGVRDCKIISQDGAIFDAEMAKNLQMVQANNTITLTYSSSFVGENSEERSSYLVLKFRLTEYPKVDPVNVPLSITWRVKKPDQPPPAEVEKPEDSGFEVTPFDENNLPKFDTIIIEDRSSRTIQLPPVKNSVGRTSPLYIDLVELSELVTYDPDTQTLHIDGDQLNSAFVGTYDIIVEVGFGEGQLEQRIEAPLKIIVRYNEAEESEEPLEEDNQGQVPAGFDVLDDIEQTNFTPSGVVIPAGNIKVLTEFQVKESLKPAQATGKEPIPSIRSVDESGLLTIDWSKVMIPRLDLTKIEQQTYAVLDEADGKRNLARRREWFNTDDKYLKYILIVEALEVSCVANYADGETNTVPLTWQMANFDDRENQIQLYFRNKDLQTQMGQRNEISVTFWGTQFFKSIDDEEVRFGERIEVLMRWNTIIDTSDLTGTAGLASLANILILVTFLAMPILAALQSSLLSIWIMIIYLQIIAHMPLINSEMPSEVLLFLRQILGMLRLQFWDASRKSGRAFNAIFEQAGYTETVMSGNISTLVTVMLPSIVIVSAIVLAYESIYNKTRLKKLPRWARQLMSSLVTFACLFHTYCLLEIYLCSLVEIRATGEAMGWFAIIAITSPFVYTMSLLWKFEKRFSAVKGEKVEEKQQSDASESLSSESVSEEKEEQELSKSLDEESDPKIELEDKKPTEEEKDIYHLPAINQRHIGRIIDPDEELTPASGDREQRKSLEFFEGGDTIKLVDNGTCPIRHKAKSFVNEESSVKEKSRLAKQVFYGRKISKYSLVFNLAFAFRAFMFSLAVVFFDDWPFPTQLVLVLVTTTIYFSLALHAGSHLWIEKTIRYQFIINEIMVVVATMFHFLFSDFVDNFDQRSEIGEVFIILIFCTIVANFIFIIAQTVGAIRKNIKQKRLRSEHEKRQIELQSQTENPLLKSSTAADNTQKGEIFGYKHQAAEDLLIGQLDQNLHRKNKSSKVVPQLIKDENSDHERDSWQEGQLLDGRQQLGQPIESHEQESWQEGQLLDGLQQLDELGSGMNGFIDDVEGDININSEDDAGVQQQVLQIDEDLENYIDDGLAASLSGILDGTDDVQKQYNIDKLDDLDIDVALDEEQPGIVCKIDDSQDLTIMMSGGNLLPPDSMFSQPEGAVSSDLLIQSSDSHSRLNIHDRLDASTVQTCVKDGSNTRSEQLGVSRDDSKQQKSAMEIAEELQIEYCDDPEIEEGPIADSGNDSLMRNERKSHAVPQFNTIQDDMDEILSVASQEDAAAMDQSRLNYLKNDLSDDMKQVHQISLFHKLDQIECDLSVERKIIDDAMADAEFVDADMLLSPTGEDASRGLAANMNIFQPIGGDRVKYEKPQPQPKLLPAKKQQLAGKWAGQKAPAYSAVVQSHIPVVQKTEIDKRKSDNKKITRKSKSKGPLKDFAIKAAQSLHGDFQLATANYGASHRNKLLKPIKGLARQASQPEILNADIGGGRELSLRLKSQEMVSFDSDHGGLSLQLMQAQNPHISQRELSAFKDSGKAFDELSPATQSDGGGSGGLFSESKQETIFAQTAKGMIPFGAILNFQPEKVQGTVDQLSSSAISQSEF